MGASNLRAMGKDGAREPSYHWEVGQRRDCEGSIKDVKRVPVLQINLAA